MLIVIVVHNGSSSSSSIIDSVFAVCVAAPYKMKLDARFSFPDRRHSSYSESARFSAHHHSLFSEVYLSRSAQFGGKKSAIESALLDLAGSNRQ